jgi:hypothetical protein
MNLDLSKEAEGADAPSLLSQDDLEVPHLTGHELAVPKAGSQLTTTLPSPLHLQFARLAASIAQM